MQVFPRALGRFGRVLFFVSFIGLFSFPSFLKGGDAKTDLQSFTPFKTVDLDLLHGGEILQSKVSMSEFPRGLAAEGCFVLPVEFSKAVDAVRSWDTSQDPVLGTYIHRPVQNPAVMDDFKDLSTLADQPKLNWLVSKVQETGSGGKRLIFLSDREMAQMNRCINTAREPARILTECWPEILLARASTVQSEGLPASIPYDVNGSTIHIHKELKSLLSQEPEVQKQFDRLLQGAIFSQGAVAPEFSPQYYWEIDEIDKHPAFNLGLTCSDPGDKTFQFIDLTFYSSGGFYTSAMMLQLWPVIIQGKEETLIWRGDIVSAPDLENIYGVEKMAASSLMLKEMKKAIIAFKAKASKS